MVNPVPILLLMEEQHEEYRRLLTAPEVSPIIPVTRHDVVATPSGFSGYYIDGVDGYLGRSGTPGIQGWSGTRGMWDQQWGPGYIRETLWEPSNEFMREVDRVRERRRIEESQTCPEVKADLSVEDLMERRERDYLNNLEDEANAYLKSIYKSNLKKAHVYIPASVAAFIINIPLILLMPLLSIPVCCATIWGIIKSIQYYRLTRHGPVMIDINNPDGLPYYYYKHTDYYGAKKVYVEDVYYLK